MPAAHQHDAHVTNRMAQIEGDFEKGEADGAQEALEVISAAARAWNWAHSEAARRI